MARLCRGRAGSAPYREAALSDPEEPLDEPRDRKNAPRRRTFSLLHFLGARLASARLIDQRGLTAVAILAAPSLNRRLAGDLMLDHSLAHRQAVFQAVLNHGELNLVRICVMTSACVEYGLGATHGICAGPLTSRGLGNAKLRGEGAMANPLLEDLDGTLPDLVRVLVASDIPATS